MCRRLVLNRRCPVILGRSIQDVAAVSHHTIRYRGVNQQNIRVSRNHVPATNNPTRIDETPASIKKAIPEALFEELGGLSCLGLVIQTSPPHSADGTSGAACLPSGFSAATIATIPLYRSLAGAPREQRLLALPLLRISSPPVFVLSTH